MNKTLVIDKTEISYKGDGYLVHIRQYTKRKKRDGRLYEWKQRVVVIPSKIPLEPNDLGPYIMYKPEEDLIVLRKMDKI